MSRLKVLSERFGYLGGYQERAEELAVMDKKLDEYSDLLDRLAKVEKQLKEVMWLLFNKNKSLVNVDSRIRYAERYNAFFAEQKEKV